jgi:5-methylcytosine-specific restriction endonuclease McrA
MPCVDPELRRARAREYYARNRQKTIDRVKRGRALHTKEYKKRNRDRQRARWVAQGLTTRGEARKTKIQLGNDGYERLTEQNARQAWRYWVQVKAPDAWVREAYRSIGRPWSNPRLSDARQWKIQYWCDPVFRAKEIEKVQRLKERRRAWIDANNDGSITADSIMRLFADAKACCYCGKDMRSVEKSMDHVVPLSRGGAHALSNVVIACKPCNFEKGTRTQGEWRHDAPEMGEPTGGPRASAADEGLSPELDAQSAPPGPPCELFGSWF